MASTGPEANILEPSAEQCHRIFLENPILSIQDLEVSFTWYLHLCFQPIIHEFCSNRLWATKFTWVLYQVIKATKHRGWHTHVVDITYPVSEGVQGLMPALDRIADECCKAAKDGYQMLVLSDRNAGPER